MGVSQSCKVAIAYAVRHPDRVSHLILYGGDAAGLARQGPEAAERARAVDTLHRLGWGNETHPFSETIARRLMADGRPDQIRWWTELQRITASTETAARIRQTFLNADAVDLLPQVVVPTLVIHRQGDTAVPFEGGRQMAASIPGARFIALTGRNHIIIESEEEWPEFVEEIRRFLKT
jgi:pimeloyl-ACP methyl ester carboxylesterase